VAAAGDTEEAAVTAGADRCAQPAKAAKTNNTPAAARRLKRK